MLPIAVAVVCILGVASALVLAEVRYWQGYRDSQLDERFAKALRDRMTGRHG